MPGKRGGRSSVKMTALVLAYYGTECHLKLKGCTKVATTKDHLTPDSHGGADVLENYRPACKPCNSKRQNRVMPGYGASVVVVQGPPGAGKREYVRTHAKPDDVVIDYAMLAAAIAPVAMPTSQAFSEQLRATTSGAYRGAIHRATRLKQRCVVWIINPLPTKDELEDYEGMRWQVITIDPGRAVVEARVRATLPESQMLTVHRWYSTHPERETPARELVPAVGADSEPDW